MSRIYEALTQSDNPNREPLLKALEAEQIDNLAFLDGVKRTTTPPMTAEKTSAALKPSIVTPAVTAVLNERSDEIAVREATSKVHSVTAPAASIEKAQESVSEAERSATVRLHVSAKSPLFPFDGTDPRTAEQYRVLRTNILHHPAAPKMIVVSSAGSGDGKTISAINTAGILALRTDAQVLLIDADLRRSSITSALGLPPGRGLADVLHGDCTVDDALLRIAELPKLHVLPAGTTSLNPAELLDSAAWRELAIALRKRFRYIVVDCTPVAAVADFDLVNAVCDGVLIVVRPDHTNRKAFTKAIERVAPERVIGVLINAVEDWVFCKSEASYYGSYHA
jgi:capsular exopolysaccharide synthesis family protein